LWCSVGPFQSTTEMKILSLVQPFLLIAICLLAIAPIFLHNHHGNLLAQKIESKLAPGSGRRNIERGRLAGGAEPKSNLRQKPLIPNDDRKISTATFQYNISEEEFIDQILILDDDESLQNGNRFPPNVGNAGKFLLTNALRSRPVRDDEIDPPSEAMRCQKYFPDNHQNTHLYKANGQRRRIFLGSLIADDSWHTLGAIAMETYGIYTSVVFVESNRTQTGAARELRFVNGTIEHKLLVESDLFGPDTAVTVENFFYEGEVDGGGLIREHRQRDVIFKAWKRLGMRDDDIGVLSDADETPTRDFLRAVQICDIPQLRVEEQDCHSPKLVVSSMVFEGSPECMTVTRKWMHPDFMLGKCIEGVGDDRYKLSARQRKREFAWRADKFSAKFNYSGWPKENELYPLWNPADFRRDTGGFSIMFEDVDYLPFRMGHTGFHFHNYFETTQQLRTKYMTYGHPVQTADEMAIGEIHPDLDLMVDCVLGKPSHENKHRTLPKRLHDFEGRIPVAYELNGYTMARHLELKSIILEDERGHNGTWHDTSNPRKAENSN